MGHWHARALDSRDGDDIRRGFRTEICNSRGVYHVDPTGKPEMELSKEWERKAEAVESEGFARLGAVLRDVAKSYERDANSVKLEYEVDTD